MINAYKIKVFTIIIACSVLISGGYYIVKVGFTERGTPSDPRRVDTLDAVTKLPQGVPVEGIEPLEQAYTLDYGAGSGNQSTITFDSPKTVFENYDLYAAFFMNNKWIVVNSYKTPETSTLYGVKDNLALSVTMSTTGVMPPVQSKVTVSFLKK